MAKDLRIRSIPIPTDLTENEIKQLIAFAIDNGAQKPVATSSLFEWHVDSHWNPRESLIVGELWRMRPPS